MTHRRCPPDWLDNFLDPFFTIIGMGSWTIPSGVAYGVTVNEKEMDSTAAYAATFTQDSNLASADMGMDIYSFDSTARSLYMSTIGSFHGVPSGAVHSVFVEEFGPESWTYASGPSGQACAIVGLQSCTWSASNQDFFASLLPFLSSQGVTDASLYGTEIIGACAPIYPDNGQDNDAFAAVTAAMQNHQYSLSGSRLSTILKQWNTTNIRGCSLFGGSLIP